MGTSTDKYPYHNIRRIHQTNQDRQANELLKAGWILLDVVTTQVGDKIFDTYYVLGHTEEGQDPETGEAYRMRKISEMISQLDEDEDK